MRGIIRVSSVDPAGGYHPDRRIVALHGADLYRRGVAAQKHSFVKVQRVLLVRGRVVQRRVERNEIVPLRLDLRTAHAREAQRTKDLADLVHHPGDWVACASPGLTSGEGQVRYGR